MTLFKGRPAGANQALLLLLLLIILGQSTVTAEYTWFRMRITQTRTGCTSDGRSQYDELYLMAGAQRLLPPLPVTSITTNVATEPNEGVTNLFDQTIGSGLEFTTTPGGVPNNADVQLSSPQCVTTYTWTTAADESCRDPISWELYGSNDGADWDIIHTVVNYATPTTRTFTLPTFTAMTCSPSAAPTTSPTTSKPSASPTTSKPSLAPSSAPSTSRPSLSPIVPTPEPSKSPSKAFSDLLCRPTATLKAAPCFKRIKACNRKLIRMKWTGLGCTRPTRLGDGGCQCKGYCGYGCQSACQIDKECFWNAAQGACFNKATNERGEPIPQCRPQ